MIIGLAGYAKAGKDTVGKYLEEQHGFQRLAFADPLRDIATVLDPFVDWDPVRDVPLRYSEALAVNGYDEAKERFREIRRFLQVLGTEVGRDMLGTDFWVELALRRVEDGRDVVFTDMRFPNEVAAVRMLSGSCWRIDRPGFGPVNGHASETAVDDVDYDFHLDNAGFIEDLQAQVDECLIDLDEWGVGVTFILLAYQKYGRRPALVAAGAFLMGVWYGVLFVTAGIFCDGCGKLASDRSTDEEPYDGWLVLHEYESSGSVEFDMDFEDDEDEDTETDDDDGTPVAVRSEEGTTIAGQLVEPDPPWRVDMEADYHFCCVICVYEWAKAKLRERGLILSS